MSKIYKYASIDSGLLILKNGKIVMSDPATFNDSFDSELFVKNNNIRLGLETYIDFLLENELLELFKTFMYGKNKKHIKVFKSFIKRINRRRKKSIKRGSYSPLITMRYLETMSLIFGFTIFDDIKNKALESFDYIYNNICNDGVTNIKKLIGSLPSNLRISCLSKRPDIPKMWVNYANKHNGICLEYENINSIYSVEYIKKEKYVDFYKFVKRYLATLCNTNTKVDDKTFISLFPFLNKSMDWKEEQEIRVVISSQDKLLTKEIVDNKEVELYPVGKPSRVVIGIGVSDADKNKVLSICKENNIPVSFCKKKNYKILID